MKRGLISSIAFVSGAISASACNLLLFFFDILGLGDLLGVSFPFGVPSLSGVGDDLEKSIDLLILWNPDLPVLEAEPLLSRSALGPKCSGTGAKSGDGL